MTEAKTPSDWVSVIACSYTELMETKYYHRVASPVMVKIMARAQDLEKMLGEFQEMMPNGCQQTFMNDPGVKRTLIEAEGMLAQLQLAARISGTVGLEGQPTFSYQLAFQWEANFKSFMASVLGTLPMRCLGSDPEE